MNLWNKKDIPHRGWINVGYEDLESPDHTCEMCSRPEIRYVHHMKHDDHPTILKVGQVCAEHMSEDYTTAGVQLAKMQKRTNWMTKGWKKDIYYPQYEYEEKRFNSVIGRIEVGVFMLDDVCYWHMDGILKGTTFTDKHNAKKYIYERYSKG
jgi:hypothetical protein